MGNAVPAMLCALVIGLGAVVAGQTVVIRRLMIYRRDGLSDLLVRRAWERGARSALKRGAKRHPGMIPAVIVADIDNMRAYNAGSYEGGDAVIRATGLRMRRSRVCHHGGRVGGDEFAALAWLDPVIRLDVARDELEAAIGGPVEMPTGGQVTVTVSVGIAVLGPDGRAPVNALACAGRRALRRKGKKPGPATADATAELPTIHPSGTSGASIGQHRRPAYAA